MNFYFKVWRKANRLWRKFVAIPVTQLFCRHDQRAYHQRAFQYDANPPHNRYRWAIAQREICPKCGKQFGRAQIVRDELSRNECAKIMHKLKMRAKQ